MPLPQNSRATTVYLEGLMLVSKLFSKITYIHCDMVGSQTSNIFAKLAHK